MARAGGGPDVPTLVERIVGLFHVPYIFGALILAALIGPPGALLVAYVQTGDPSKAILSTVYLFTSNAVSVQGAIATAMIFPLFFYALYGIRYMRSTVATDEENVKDLLPGGKESYEAIFASISNKLPPLILSVLLVVGLIPPQIGSQTLFFSAPLPLGFFLIAFPMAILLFSTFVWVYLSSIRGLRELGRGPLTLKPYHEDSMLGVRPLGSLSLSFALVYFTGLAILAMDFIVNSAQAIPVSEGVIMAVLILVGVVFFLLPLNAIHHRMVGVKKAEMAQLRSEFARTKEAHERDTPAAKDVSLSDLRETLAQVTNVMMFDVNKNEVSSIPTWPFDTSILGRLAVVLLSVMAILLAKYLFIALGLG